MDEAIALIRRGCELAKELESSLPNLANQLQSAASLSKSCDEIIRTFTAAKQRLILYPPPDPDLTLSRDQHHENDPTCLQEWLRANNINTSATDQLLQMQLMAARTPPSEILGSSRLGGGIELEILRSGGLVVDSGGRSDVQVNNPGRASSSQRPRRRKDDAEKRTVRMSAPQMGNTEIPPEDGFTWRKYGQKEILRARFPRSYYRCTHQKLYNCPAKKQVQRLDDDPSTFEITYRGEHTCHMTATAPSVQLPQMTSGQVIPSAGASSSSGSQIGGWLQFRVGGSGGGAGPSTVRSYNRELPDYNPITDMADVMFNSGSGSSNMELIFTQNMGQDKYWDPLQEEKKDDE